MPREIDRNWADGVGLGIRPWSAVDHLRDYLLVNTTVKNVANDKAFYVPVGSEFDYLRGKGVAEFKDKNKYPSGQGIWYKSVTMKNCVVDGVARRNNDKIQNAHTDAIYIASDVAVNKMGAKTDFEIRDCVVRNCDGSCMPILIQNPTVLGTFKLVNFVMEDTVAQRRVVLKPGISIDVIRIENCGPMTLSPDNANLKVGRVELYNSPQVNAKALSDMGIPVVDVSAGPAPDPDPNPTPTPTPSPTPPVVVKKIVKVVAFFEDGTTQEFKP